MVSCSCVRGLGLWVVDEREEGEEREERDGGGEKRGEREILRLGF